MTIFGRKNNSFRLPKVAKDCPSLPDLTISTNTTTTHNKGIILQSNQSNSTEQKKTIHVVYSLLLMIG